MLSISSPIRASDILVWNRGHQRYVLMLRAYLDDSGSDDTPVLCIGGGLSPKENWEQLEEQWSHVLQQYGVKILHMTDLESLRGEFLPSQRWTKERRESLLCELLPIITQHVQYYVGCNARDKDPDLKRYHDAGMQCVKVVLQEVQGFPEDEKVEIIFEKTPRLTGPIVSTFADLIGTEGYERLASVSVGRKEVVALQAADLIVYEYRKLMTSPRGTPQPWPLQQLLEHPDRCKFRN